MMPPKFYDLPSGISGALSIATPPDFRVEIEMRAKPYPSGARKYGKKQNAYFAYRDKLRFEMHRQGVRFFIGGQGNKLWLKPMLTGAWFIYLEIHIADKIKRGDSDNIAKGIQDALFKEDCDVITWPVFVVGESNYTRSNFIRISLWERRLHG